VRVELSPSPSLSAQGGPSLDKLCEERRLYAKSIMGAGNGWWPVDIDDASRR
jgi:hypothetical protein